MSWFLSPFDYSTPNPGQAIDQNQPFSQKTSTYFLPTCTKWQFVNPLRINQFVPACTKWQFVNPPKSTNLGIENQPFWHDTRRLGARALSILEGGEKISEPQPPAIALRENPKKALTPKEA
ncbi:MAG: hypothetical protein EBE86_026180 [Hormoscilla sp. GUM202]|nr:hypothetical protein [Hormoscilla sp. GUM202]MBO1350646.1 hypothetical protein [Hormoscilla sp. GUM202]